MGMVSFIHGDQTDDLVKTREKVPGPPPFQVSSRPLPLILDWTIITHRSLEHPAIPIVRQTLYLPAQVSSAKNSEQLKTNGYNMPRNGDHTYDPIPAVHGSSHRTRDGH